VPSLAYFELIGKGSERKDRVANGQLQVMTAILLHVSFRLTQPAPVHSQAGVTSYQWQVKYPVSFRLPGKHTHAERHVYPVGAGICSQKFENGIYWF
jgi:hypothetical protein